MQSVRERTRAHQVTPDERQTVLVVDNDVDTREVLAVAFESDGYRVAVADTARQARELCDTVDPSLVVLEFELPDAHGLVLCGELRSKSEVPIVLMSNRAERWQQTVGFQLGADDYLAKPFDLSEVRARLARLLRRSARGWSAQTGPGHLRLGSLIVDGRCARASVGDRSIPLAPIEHRLLAVLVGNADRVVTRAELAELVWRDAAVAESRTIDTHIRRLRAKLEEVAGDAPRIICEPRVGYGIAVPVVSSAEDDRRAA